MYQLNPKCPIITIIILSKNLRMQELKINLFQMQIYNWNQIWNKEVFVRK